MDIDYREILTDLDLESIEAEKVDYASSLPEYVITTYPADYTLEILTNKLKSNEILVRDFQRQFVWNQVQASKLIESFLVGLPVPAIFLYNEYDTQKKLLVDGQQRLKSVAYYLSGYFGEETKGRRKVFRLKGLNEKSKFYNKTYEDLSESDQIKLKDSVLRTFIIQQLVPADDTVIYHVFERLNTGGTFLNNQEVRNCVYHGDLNNLIRYKLNLNADYREILGKKEPDKRMVDNELILRFLSLTGGAEHYSKPLKDHLSNYLDRHRKTSGDFLEATEQLFNNTCSVVREVLGDKPFHVKRGLNVAVYDCVMNAFALNLSSFSSTITEPQKEEYRSRFKKLVDVLDEEKLMSGATTDEEPLKKRFRLAENTLFNS